MRSLDQHRLNCVCSVNLFIVLRFIMRCPQTTGAGAPPPSINPPPGKYLTNRTSGRYLQHGVPTGAKAASKPIAQILKNVFKTVGLLFFVHTTLSCWLQYFMFTCTVQCLQCFDAVGWAAGRASSL